MIFHLYYRGWPNSYRSACEFDYSGTQACKALKEEGYRVILINSNPATIMTDPEIADQLMLSYKYGNG